MKHTCKRLRVLRELVNTSFPRLPGSRSIIRSNNARLLVSIWIYIYIYMLVALQICKVEGVYLFTFM
jgi:hypothetical protein